MIATWRLEGPGGPIDIPSRKARALLACLALASGRVETRARLAALLWGDTDEDKARASLRQVISGLRAACAGAGAPLLASTPETVALVPGALATDLDQLMAAIAAGLPDDGDARRVAALPGLLADLRGVSDGFEGFAARLVDQTLATAGQRLRQIYDDPARPAQARLRAARVAAALDDLDEDALRAQMRGLAEAGNAAAALRLYGEFYARLQAELDAEPSPATQDLAVEIKLAEGQPAAAAPAPAPAAAPARPEPPPLVTVAVLPFEFLGAEPVPDYVAIGLLDQITCQLAAWRAPAVISSNTMRRYRGPPPEPAQLRAELRASYVVAGSVLQSRGQAAVAVQLIETATGLVVWAGTYHCPVTALFDIRASLAETIASVVMPSVDVAELRRAIDAPPDALEPYHLVLRARDLIFRLDREALTAAGGLLEQAVAQAPRFAPAHALLGEWHLLAHWQGWGLPTPAAQAAIERHLGQAIALSPGDGRAMALLAHCRFALARDHAGGLRLIESALTLRPGDSETLVWSTPTLAYNGQARRAVGYGRRAIDLSPLDPFLFRNEHFLSIAHYCAGEFDAAAEQGLSCFHRAPDYGSNLRMTIAALVAAGRTPEAAPLVARHAGQEPDFSVAAFMPRHGLSDPAERQRFGERLVAAGLPR